MFVENARSNCCCVMPSMSLSSSWFAALLTRMSSLPNVSTAFLIKFLAGFLASQVGFEGDAFAALGFYQALRLRRIVVRYVICYDHIRSFTRKIDGYRPSYAAVATGNNRCFPFEFIAAFVAFADRWLIQFSLIFAFIAPFC